MPIFGLEKPDRSEASGERSGHNELQLVPTFAMCPLRPTALWNTQRRST